MSIITAIMIITFTIVMAGSMSLYLYMEKRYRRRVIAKKLFGSGDRADNFEKEMLKESQWSSFTMYLGTIASPKKEKDLLSVSKMLSYAGFRSSEAVSYYFGLRFGLSLILGGLYVMFIILTGNLDIRFAVFIFFPLVLGYYIPGAVLKAKVSSRANRIRMELPDALDLLLICIEAGLSFDMALFRVSKEMENVTPLLSKEFSQYFLEIQSGLPRKKVLKNMAERNGVTSLDSIVNVLIQSSKFGTDIAEALRVYARSLRDERQKTAEEKGAKISTKLTFPLVALIMPALFMIILGPAIINLISNINGG